MDQKAKGWCLFENMTGNSVDNMHHVLNKYTFLHVYNHQTLK